MKNHKSLSLVLFAALLALSMQSARGQGTESKLANIASGGSSVRWDMAVSHSGGTLTISAPDGRVFRKEIRAGGSPDFTLTDAAGERLPDGVYTYELRLAPAMTMALKESMKSTRAKDDASEVERSTRKRPMTAQMVESGSFSIINGTAVVAGTMEERQTKETAPQKPSALTSVNYSTRRSNHRVSRFSFFDDVIADDLIVQGSACVGLDCVSGEVFGFDTIRLKENNDRLQFDDTSTSAGFPTNNWQIRANSSSSGGASFLAFVDQGSTGNSETGTIILEADAGAPANSIKVASTGKVGFRTATPVLDLHVNTSDTPAMRYEQNSSGGFAAQTWDVAGNEANFFVRDVTSGSRLPFRIRPGAPTSSVDISATGNVGVGTASPADKLEVSASSGNIGIRISSGNAAGDFSALRFNQSASEKGVIFTNQESLFIRRSSSGVLALNDSGGNVGIGTSAPTDTLSVNGTASKPGGGTWAVFSDERLKNIKGRFNYGLKAVMQLQPLRYEYKPDNALGIRLGGEQIGFAAQSVQKVIPEAVTRNSAGYLMVNSDPILWTMLNAIKEQQQQIASLRAQVLRLSRASQRRRH